MKQFPYHKQFIQQALQGKHEWLVQLGQPMLYDHDIYVLRKEHKELTPLEYFRWVKAVRVA